MANVAKQAAYLSHRTRDVEEVSARVARGLADLRGRIEMARHAADSVKGPMRMLQIRTFFEKLVPHPFSAFESNFEHHSKSADIQYGNI